MNNSDKNRIKTKVVDLIKEFVSFELNNGQEIPQKISDYLLKNYGWTGENPSDNESDLDEFVEKLEEFISRKYKSCYEKDPKNNETNQKCDEFVNESVRLETINKEHFQVHLKTIKTLVDLISLKIEYSKYLKNKSCAELLKVKDSENRVEMLKLQSLSKLYGEGSTYEALVTLKAILENERRELEVMHDKEIHQYADYEKLKNNKEYCELLKMYKELLKQEKRLDLINDE